LALPDRQQPVNARGKPTARKNPDQPTDLGSNGRYPSLKRQGVDAEARMTTTED
jgi:hypothetical protein